METNIWRLYALLLPWMALIQKCTCQIPLLTMINDQCITNTSSAMAMIYDVSYLALRNFKKDVSNIRSMKNNNGGIRDLCGKPECFNMNSWSSVNSLEKGNVNNLITDRRWEDFPTYITTNISTHNSILSYQLAASFSSDSDQLSIPFSVQVEMEAHVFVCDGQKVPESNCYWFMLQAWSGLNSGFRMCRYKEIQSYYDASAPKGFCRTSTQQWPHSSLPQFLSKDHWSHFRILKTGDEYRLVHQNGTVILFANTEIFRFKPTHLFFHTKQGTGLWKVHNFNYFYSDTPDAFLETNRPLTLSTGQNCLAMFVVMCQSCSMDIKLVTREGNVLATITADTQDQQWKEIKHVFHLTKSHDNVFLRITTISYNRQNNFWAFSHLRACDEDEVAVLTSSNPMAWTKRCQLIENEAILDGNSVTKISTLENWKKCTKDQFGENCLPCKLIFNDKTCPRNSKYCQLISGKSGIEQMCYCSIGNEGDACEEDCWSSFNYGHGCKMSCPNCQDSCHNDPIFGKCDSSFCINNYVGEKCDIQSGIFIFDDLPEIEIGSTSCILSVKSFRGKGDSRTPPQFYKFQYKEINAANWSDVAKESLTFNIPGKVTLRNLETEATYWVRVFGYVTEENLTEDVALVSGEILVKNITTICNELKENQIEIVPDELSAIIRFNIDKENSKDLCSLSGYTLTYDNYPLTKKNNEYTIGNLEPYTQYHIDVNKNGNLLFAKTFRTKESVPQKVQNFHYSKTEMASTLRFKWAKPIKTNGQLLFYDMSFQLTGYEACKDRKDITKIEFHKYFSASRKEWIETNLKPYAKYNIEIKANTSAGFGPSVSITTTTDPLGSYRKEERLYCSPNITCKRTYKKWKISKTKLSRQNRLPTKPHFETKSVNKEEIPHFQSTVPSSDKVVFKFIEAPCEEMTGPIYIDTTLTGAQFWCNSTKTIKKKELENGDLVVNELEPFCQYNAVLKSYRNDEMIEIKTSFETLESAPNKISNLEVTSKGSNYISLRWLPPYPPTGQLTGYKVVYCSTSAWKRCDSNWFKVSFKPRPCKLWPDFHCLTLSNKIKKNDVYTIKIQSKNKGSNVYSHAVEKDTIMADDGKKSKPPYGLSMMWTGENYLNLSWYHPNETNGVISEFKIKVNGEEHEYKIKSEDDYSLVYNKTIKRGLTFPNNYTVEISACNLGGESEEKASITGESPPPIPDGSVGHIDAKEKNINITFQDINGYNKRFKRFLYVLITECGVCPEQVRSYKEVLAKHHEEHHSVKPMRSIQVSQWRAIMVYDDMEANRYPKTLDVGENSTDSVPYTIRPKTNYNLAFIWINQLGRYVRSNITIISKVTASTFQDSSLFGKLVPLIVILVAALIITVAYIRLKKEIHQLLGCTKTSSTVESIYENHQILETIPSLPYKNNRNSVIIRQMPDITCPGNPLFKTKNSQRIKLDNFQEYVQKAHESKKLCRQHKLFPPGLTKPWTYGGLPENKKKNRYNNLVAYDHSRVVLNKIEGDEHSDYINASYIDGYQIPRAYIATQGPKKNTVYDFWRMIWQEKVTNIVMMANVYEGGKKKTEQYWPNNGESLQFGDFKISFLRSDVFANYEYRQFQLHFQHSKPRQVNQLHFKAWPDHGVPLYPQSLVPILEKMLTFRLRDFPILVHCSAGVGRTGTVILCDICLRMAAAEGFVDVLAMLEHLRNQRANMVDNAEQYKLAHLVVLNCLMGLRTSITVDQEFAGKIEDLFQNNDAVASQLQYIRDCEWEDDAMKTVFFMDDEEMPIIPEKNRFPDVIPDSTARVFLNPYPAQDPSPSSTYINAVRVDAFCEPGRFIVTQYPLPTTVGDFWRLVADKDISVIVCLNDIPTKDELCGLFFPISLQTLSPEDTIKVQHVRNKNFQVYTVLTFEMTASYPYQDSKITTVEIVKFRGWRTSQQVPEDYMDFMTFVEDAINIARKSSPTIITCYDGATASGLFIAMSFLIEQIKFEHACDVCQAVRSIRTSRKQFTNTEDQLKFLYKASLLYVEEKFNQYANLSL